MKTNFTKMLLVLVTVVVAVALYSKMKTQKEAVNGETQPAEVTHETTTGEANLGGSFTLVDTKGNQVTDKSYAGKMMLVFFGYSHCPDVCPATLATMTSMMKELGADADKVQPIFITVDPQRDTKEHLASFMKNYDEKIVALTGTEKEIADVAGKFKVPFGKVEPKAEEAKPAETTEAAKTEATKPAETKAPEAAKPAEVNYLVNHTNFMYLMDKDGKFVAQFGPETTAPKLVEEVKKHVAK